MRLYLYFHMENYNVAMATLNPTVPKWCSSLNVTDSDVTF